MMVALAVVVLLMEAIQLGRLVVELRGKDMPVELTVDLAAILLSHQAAVVEHRQSVAMPLQPAPLVLAAQVSHLLSPVHP